MILLKIWWSLIATKDTKQKVNISYLKKIAKFLKTFKDETIIVTHGTGNVGHGFVQEFWLSSKNQSQLRQNLDKYFEEIDQVFPGFKRLRVENIMTGKYMVPKQAKIISWGDITTEPKIVSSDDIFSYFLHHENIRDAFFLTDVDWVFDTEGKIIKEIDKTTFHGINFWNKKWDVTWAMQQKIWKLFTKSSDWTRNVRIINGENIENLKHIIENKTGTGTKIIV